MEAQEKPEETVSQVMDHLSSLCILFLYDDSDQPSYWDLIFGIQVIIFSPSCSNS